MREFLFHMEFLKNILYYCIDFNVGLMRIISKIVLISLLLSACGENLKKFEFEGGTFRMCLSDFPSTNIARQATDVHSATVLSQVMEGLVSFSPDDLKIQAQLAESWTISKDNLLYTFKIRDNVYFHKSTILDTEEKRKLQLSDIVHSIELACKKDKNNDPSPAYSSFFRNSIKGVDDFFDGKAESITGIKTEGQLLTIELAQSDANFLNKLANVNASISSKLVYDAGEENLMIGTGPFMYKGMTEEDQSIIHLERNEEYYLKDENGNQLPYLSKIELIVETRKLDELEMFEQGKTNFIASLPTSRISEMLEGRIKDFNSIPPKFILKNSPLLATNYYFFNMQDVRFKDVRVRKAFNYAIDRNKITQFILRGQAYENGVYGIVPPISNSFRGYDFKGLKEVSYDLDVEKAKQLLAEAGYPNGEGFGGVDLRINFGEFNSSVAEEISKQIKQNLGINVNIDNTSFEQKNKDATSGNGDLFRSTWFADYTSPESFLTNFYGKIVPKSKNEPSIVNQSRYQNAQFDAYFEEAKKTTKIKDRLQLFSLAEKELMKDPPLIVLWYNGDIQILDSKVRNFYVNPLNYFVFRKVYLKEWSKKEYESQMKS